MNVIIPKAYAFGIVTHLVFSLMEYRVPRAVME